VKEQPQDKPLLRLTGGNIPEAGDSSKSVGIVFDIIGKSSHEVSGGGSALLVHELAGLIDGSLRILGVALRKMDHAEKTSGEYGEIMGQLQTLQIALDRMGKLLDTDNRNRGKRVRINSNSQETLFEVINHAVKVMQPLADEKDVRVVCDINHKLNNIPAGPLYPVLSNGLRNALAACRVGGNIVVTGSADENQVEIMICDDGEGVSGEVLSQVFDFGFTTKADGQGMGLALSKDILNEMNGTITLVNNPDKGATLCITFPRKFVVNGGD